MKAAPFDYVEAGSAEEAVQILGEAGPDATVLAGGQTLMPLLALRLASPSIVVDINPAEDMAGVTRRGATTVVGARTRQAHASRDPAIAEHVPLMAEALGYVGHYQTRTRGTIGGSIALGEPAAEMPALAVALDAQIELRSRRGSRMVAAREFYVGPYATVRDDDEVLIAVHYPDWPGSNIGIFHEVARRAGDFALVGLIATIAINGDKIGRAGIAWFGMGPTPIAAVAAEQALVGAHRDHVDLAELARTALTEVEPADDLHASARYRRTVASRVFQRRVDCR
ncbi:FAD binding domain-containing protein [Rhizorhapis sp. SPR117]|uniref:FAD binding domain-containing protein n=1 Tax=Rhizorhapis sp. SPR117 TaxID=2912611 RepID=UPI001F2093F8|nr:FAD binding domain-containing protein [Rhizorhapis sp. SPR117]